MNEEQNGLAHNYKLSYKPQRELQALLLQELRNRKLETILN